MPASPDALLVLLARTPPFQQLPAGVLQRAIAGVPLASFAPDARILAQGSDAPAHLYIVLHGHVRLLDTARARLVDACGEGDCFGHQGLLTAGPLPYEARAAEATTCALLPAATFRTLCAAHPAFAAFFDPAPVAPPLPAPVDAAGTRLLFHTTLGELVRRPPVTCAPHATAREAAQAMRAERVGSILVVHDGRAAGILTGTDLRDRIVAEGRAAGMPVAQLMSSPVVSLDAAAPVFDGLMALMRHGMHHLVVTDGPAPGAPVVGVISDQDLARAQHHTPAGLVRRIERAGTLDALAGIRPALEALLLQLYRQGVQPGDLIAVSSEVNDRLTTRVLQLVEAGLAAEQPEARPETPWAWMALGSEGRREMSLKTDQDNALVYADPSSDEEAARASQWFAALAARANAALARCGFTPCPGDVMAQNPRWCQPLRAWKTTFGAWIAAPEPQALMHAAIFFDLRSLHGEAALVDVLRAHLLDALDRERGFLSFLMHNARANRPPLSFFRRFVLEHSGEHRHTFDVKLRGLMPLVDLARILALDARYLDTTNTLDRLRQAEQALPRLAATAASARDAYRYLAALRLEHQLAAVAEGRAPDNHVDPATLSKTQQHVLKAVFATIGDMQDVMAHRYGAAFMRS